MEQQELFNSLKWKELAEIEEYLGYAMDEWDSVPSKAKLAFAMQYIIAKRNNPELTLEQAEDMSITDLSEIAGVQLALPKGA